MRKLVVFLITLALFAGMASCAAVWHALTIASTEGGSVNAPGEGTFDFQAGTVVDLIAVADAGYRFVNWTGDVDTIVDVKSAETTITMSGNYEITARFEKVYELTVSSSEGGSVTTPGEGTFLYAAGTVVYLEASPASGCRFLNWTGDVDAIEDIEDASTTITIHDSYAIAGEFTVYWIEIWDWYDLDAIRNDLSGNYVLMEDLDSSTAGYGELASQEANGGKGWQPIGSEDSPFAGTFDGQGYEISDLRCDRPAEPCVGLFGYVSREGVLKNVGVVTVSVVGSHFVGGLVGTNWGTVVNSYSTGSMTGINHRVGGLVGYNMGNVSNSRFSGSVAGLNYVGGLVGGNGRNIIGSYATATVSGSIGVGGLVGRSSGTVSNCYAGCVIRGDQHAGGLLGRNMGSVWNSFSSGGVTGALEVGGLVGSNHSGTVLNSFWDVEAAGTAAGVAGEGKTTAQMKDIATFASWEIVAVGSDETNPAYVWNIVDGQTYPFLSGQSVP